TVDGVVVVGLDETHPDVDALRQAGLPMVIVDAQAWDEHGSVDVDDEGGARAAAEHLVELGHRDIVVIAIPSADARAAVSMSGVVGRRLRGYRHALDAAGIALPSAHIVEANATFE